MRRDRWWGSIEQRDDGDERIWIALPLSHVFALVLIVVVAWNFSR